ncbi:MAG: arginine repressor [Propionibacteriaceae bacterium]|jgi:transcriptional regulator of arginine metabolism|nr:arginine repressor [Propionibacteriaceae bacterium]
MSHPLTKSARQARIASLIEHSCIASQAELAALLADEGFSVSQGTLSKDLEELGAVRVRGEDGGRCYALISSPATQGAAVKLAKVAQDLLLSADGSANITVLITPPGAAQFFASHIDRAGMPEILGTIAGDDTVLVVTKDPSGGPALAERMLNLKEG